MAIKEGCKGFACLKQCEEHVIVSLAPAREEAARKLAVLRAYRMHLAARDNGVAAVAS